MSRVINLNGRRLPKGAVYVGRTHRRIGEGSPVANPFVIGRDGTREDVLTKYETWLMSKPELVAWVKENLRGKDLACWCSPLPCHGHILMRVASSDD